MQIVQARQRAKFERVIKQLGLGTGRVTPWNNGEWTVDLPSSDHRRLLGQFRFVPRDDGSYSLLFAPWFPLTEGLSKAGFPIHKRAKPTRKTRSVTQLCRM